MSCIRLASLRRLFGKVNLPNMERNISILNCPHADSRNNSKSCLHQLEIRHRCDYLPHDYRPPRRRTMKPRNKSNENLNITDTRQLLESIPKSVVSSSETLEILRSGETSLSLEKSEDRLELVKELWCRLKKQGTVFNIMHYNSLLKIYTENELVLNPSEISQEMKDNGITPNNATFQLLMMAHCQTGDIDSALSILNIMREKDLPITPYVYSALIIGYARNNNMKKAESIAAMSNKENQKSGHEGYCTLIIEHLRRNETNEAKYILKIRRLDNLAAFPDLNFKLLYSFAVNDDMNEFNKILKDMVKPPGYNVRAQILVIKLVNAGKPEFAFKVLKTMSIYTYERGSGGKIPLGDFFISALIKNDVNTNSLVQYCLEMINGEIHSNALNLAMELSLRYQKEELALELFAMAKSKEMPVRLHYFWPLLVHHGKQNNTAGVFRLLKVMHEQFDLNLDAETIRVYVMPYLMQDKRNVQELLSELKSLGVSTSTSASSIVYHLLDINNIQKAAQVAKRHQANYPYFIFQRSLVTSFLLTKDYVSLITLLKAITLGEIWRAHFDPRVSLGFMVNDLVKGLLRENSYGDIILLIEHLIENNFKIDEKQVSYIQELLPKELAAKVLPLMRKITSGGSCTPSNDSENEKTPLESLDEKSLERLSENMDPRSEDALLVKINLYALYGRNKNLDKVMKIKKELDSLNFSESQYAFLIDTLVDHDNWKDALDVCTQQYEKNPNFCLDTVKLVRLAWLLTRNERVEDAMQLLTKKALKETMNQNQIKTVRELYSLILDYFAKKGDVQKVEQAFNLLITRRFVPIHNSLIASRVRVHLVRNDIDSAVETFEKCVNEFNLTPCKTDLMRSLILKGDEKNLNVISDISTSIHGEGGVIYDLVLVYLECDKVEEAAKILQSRDYKLSEAGKQVLVTACNRYCRQNNVKHLQFLLEILKNTNIFDTRSELYKKILSVCDRSKDEANTTAVRTDTSCGDSFDGEEDFKKHVIKFKKKYGSVEPPALDLDEPAGESLSEGEISVSTKELRKLISSQSLDKALKLAKSCSSVVTNAEKCAILVDACLKLNQYVDAKELFLEYNKKTWCIFNHSVMKRLTTAAARNGDVAFLELCRSQLSEDIIKKLSFENVLTRAYNNANRVEERLAQLEHQLDSIQDETQLQHFLTAFPRGGIIGVMLQKPEHIAGIKSLCLKCIERGDRTVIPNTLWIYHMLKKEYSEADVVWKEYLNYGEILNFNLICQTIKKDVDVELGEHLINTLESKEKISAEFLGIAYSALIAAYVEKNHIEDALATLRRALMRVTPSDLVSVSFLSLKAACASNKIPFPYEQS